MYQRILVATDDSRLSRKAVRAAVELAASTGATLVPLHVVPRYPLASFDGVLSRSADEVGCAERQWAERGRAIVDAAADAATRAGVEARAAVAYSDHVGESVVAAAKRHRCDLVVMASHGRRGLQRVLLGSETQYVLTHCSVPVLVLR